MDVTFIVNQIQEKTWRKEKKIYIAFILPLTKYPTWSQELLFIGAKEETNIKQGRSKQTRENGEDAFSFSLGSFFDQRYHRLRNMITVTC